MKKAARIHNMGLAKKGRTVHNWTGSSVARRQACRDTWT